MGNLLQSSVDNFAAGILAGIALAALVCYALFLAVIPAAKAHPVQLKKAAGLLAVLLVIKTAALLFFPGFRVDVGTYESWALQLATVGPASMYHSGYFLDYPPGYLYALWAAGELAHAVAASGNVLRMIIGSPALIADFMLSLLLFAALLHWFGKTTAWIGMLFFAVNPA
ncbi:MAG TPA: hypothetical protein VJ721_02500, partial [Chthoniobacterales bacterium]|nr:hypothetical protein [Chthoniobacterales bacterium]